MKNKTIYIQPRPNEYVSPAKMRRFVIFVYVAIKHLTRLSFTHYWSAVESSYYMEKLLIRLVHDERNFKIKKVKGEGHWERKSKNCFFAHYLRES